MQSAHTLLSFFGLSIALGLFPGPDNLYVLARSTLDGARTGLLVTLGLCTGLVVHTLLACLGLGVVIAGMPHALTAIKYAGAAYLGYCAWQSVMAIRKPAAASSGASRAEGRGGPYLRGFLMNISNPKVLLFFAALFPQFLQEGDTPAAAQLAWLGLVFIGGTLVSFGSICVFASSLKRFFDRSERARIALEAVCAATFVCLCIGLLWSASKA